MAFIVSKNLLNKYVSWKVSDTELADMLSRSGAEVESLSAVNYAPDGVLVGEIVAVEKHPNADKLNLCQVNTGDQVFRYCVWL